MAVNPHASQPTSPTSLFKSLWQHRELIRQMAWREVIGRYRGSVMGLLWSFLNPVLMLAVYTFVFSVVFKARWGSGGEETKSMFALVLFVGMTVHALLAEVLNRAPGLILSHVNYVKKVIFPLEILPVISFISAFFHTIVSLLVLLVAALIIKGALPSTIVFFPFVILPLAILILGAAWILASLGVYLRDISLTINIVTMVMLFLAPVFYPVSALPEAYRHWLFINPLTFIIEQAREVLIWGHSPDWSGLILYTVFASIFAWVGYAWFQKTRKGFADVL